MRVAWRAVGAIIDRVVADGRVGRDPFGTLRRIGIDVWHVVSWAADALDQVRREAWNEVRGQGMRKHAKELEGCRHALWRNPEELTARQEAELPWFARANGKLYRFSLLKEQLRLAIWTKGDLGLSLLERWRSWAARSRVSVAVERSMTINRNPSGIEAAPREKISNALIEATNTRLCSCSGWPLASRIPRTSSLSPSSIAVGTGRRFRDSHEPPPLRLSFPPDWPRESPMTHGSSRRPPRWLAPGNARRSASRASPDEDPGVLRCAPDRI